MKYCPNCDKFFNNEQIRFCGTCGTALEEAYTCPNCNTANSSEYAFCVKCGAPLRQQNVLNNSGITCTAPIQNIQTNEQPGFDKNSIHDSFDNQEIEEINEVKPIKTKFLDNFSKAFFKDAFQTYVVTIVLFLILFFIFPLLAAFILPKSFFDVYIILLGILSFAFLIIPFAFAVWIDYRKHEHHIAYLLIKWFLIHTFVIILIFIKGGEFKRNSGLYNFP